MDIEMELSQILIRENHQDQIIVLSERNGDRAFPIAIELHQALAIQRRLNGIKTPRPMTHELIHSVITAMGGTLERIVINDLRPTDGYQTFFALLIIRRGEELIEVDTRPSDAIALGIGLDVPFFVAEHVLDLET